MNTQTKTLKKNIQDGAEAAVEAASDAAGKAKATVQGMAAEAKLQATEAATALRDGAAERLDDARDALGDSGDRLAETLRRAAQEPEAGSIQARVLQAVAGGVSSAANTLHDRSISQMAADFRALAQRHPGAFAVGAAAAGFALARFLRASSARQDGGNRS